MSLISSNKMHNDIFSLVEKSWLPFNRIIWVIPPLVNFLHTLYVNIIEAQVVFECCEHQLIGKRVFF